MPKNFLEIHNIVNVLSVFEKMTKSYCKSTDTLRPLSAHVHTHGHTCTHKYYQEIQASKQTNETKGGTK